MAKKKLPTVNKSSGGGVVHIPAIERPTQKKGQLSQMLGGRSARANSVIGVGGTSIRGGIIDDQEEDVRLRGRDKYKTYSEILANTSIVAAGTRYFLNLLAKADWKVVPADDTPAAKELAETVEDIMNSMQRPWHRIIRRGAMYRFYGFSIQEWTAKKREDGHIGMLDIAPRPQSTITKWDTDETGKILGMVQEDPTNFKEIYLPREKVIYHVDDSLNDSPEGLGIFRHLASPAARLKRYLELEGWGFETDLHGVPVARLPLAELQQMVDDNTITAEDRTKMEAPLRDFINNHVRGVSTGLLLDSLTYQTEDEKGAPSTTYQWDVDLLQATATSQTAVAAAIERLNLEMARILGTEHLLLGADGSGSLALSRDKSHNFFLLVDSTLRELRWTMEQDFLNPLWKLNGWPEELKPELRTEAIQFRDIEQITSALRDMALAGAQLAPDDPAINEVRELLGLSPMSSESMLLDAILGGNSNPEDDPKEDKETDDLEDDTD